VAGKNRSMVIVKIAVEHLSNLMTFNERFLFVSIRNPQFKGRPTIKNL
jgi:hypothetical protein